MEEVLESFSSQPKFTKDKYCLSKFKERKIEKIVTKPDEMLIVVCENGLFLAEKISGEPVDNVIFDINAKFIYDRVKEELHIHIFRHVLGPRFPIIHSLNANARKDVAKKIEVLKKELEKKYLDELTNERIELTDKRRFFAQNLVSEINKLLNWKRGFFTFWILGLPRLIHRRMHLSEVCERIYNATGVQTFINSFCKLVRGERKTREVDFLNAQKVYGESIQEFGNVIGQYTLQAILLTVAMLGLASPLIAIFFVSIASGWQFGPKLFFFFVWGLSYYIAGYWTAYKIGKRHKELTALFIT